MKNLVVTEENFDSRALFYDLSTDMLNALADPSDSVYDALNVRLDGGAALIDAICAELAAHVSFDSDDTLHDWVRFMGDPNPCAATAQDAVDAIAQLAKSEFAYYPYNEAFAGVDKSRTFAKSHFHTGAARKMLSGRAKSFVEANKDGSFVPSVRNEGYPFTRTDAETKALYDYMLANPHEAERRTFCKISNYQLTLFQRLLGTSDIKATSAMLGDKIGAAQIYAPEDAYAKIGNMTYEYHLPSFDPSEKRPPVSELEDALTYSAAMSTLASYYSRKSVLWEGDYSDADEYARIAYLYGDTDFSISRVHNRLASSSTLTDILTRRNRPSYFCIVNADTVNAVMKELGIDEKAVQAFFAAHRYKQKEDGDRRGFLPIVKDALEEAMYEDAEEFCNRVGDFSLAAYNDNLRMCAEAGKLPTCVESLCTRWNPTDAVMKWTVTFETRTWDAVDMHGQALTDAFHHSLVNLYKTFAGYGIPGTVCGHFKAWLDQDYLDQWRHDPDGLHIW